MDNTFYSKNDYRYYLMHYGTKGHSGRRKRIGYSRSRDARNYERQMYDYRKSLASGGRVGQDRPNPSMREDYLQRRNRHIRNDARSRYDQTKIDSIRTSRRNRMANQMARLQKQQSERENRRIAAQHQEQIKRDRLKRIESMSSHQRRNRRLNYAKKHG